MGQQTNRTIQQKLQAAGYKLTPQREMTLQVLLDKDEEHLSAEEIYMLLKANYPSIGLATVYRTLDILTEIGVIYKVNFDDGLARYDLKTTGSEHFHHHLLCLECGKIDEVFDDLLVDIEPIVERDYQFKVVDHRLTFHGICAECQAKQLNKKGYANESK
ncbi:Fur family transcriptional regulator [Atopobacter phocae]|uniref:ferric iron uptake transcriptional regulator n=1 Tax=Atopobacter phocae TaxID=136492 RepID=UPI00046F04D6|nr:Fur family transcriptional regulator [Atopobacter phocae]